MISERIKLLREQNNMTQSALARELGVTRSAVNAWEMGISVPSTMYLVELAHLFAVSTDHILGLEDRTMLDISGIDDDGIRILNDMVQYMRCRN